MKTYVKVYNVQKHKSSMNKDLATFTCYNINIYVGDIPTDGLFDNM